MNTDTNNSTTVEEHETEEFLTKQVRSDILAHRIKLLFAFCYDFGKDLDLLKETLSSLEKDVALTGTLAPILGATGLNYQDIEFEKEMQAKRARALYNLVKTLVDTESAMKDYKKKQEAGAEARQQLQKLLRI